MEYEENESAEEEKVYLTSEICESLSSAMSYRCDLVAQLLYSFSVNVSYRIEGTGYQRLMDLYYTYFRGDKSVWYYGYEGAYPYVYDYADFEVDPQEEYDIVSPLEDSMVHSLEMADLTAVCRDFSMDCSAPIISADDIRAICDEIDSVIGNLFYYLEYSLSDYADIENFAGPAENALCQLADVYYRCLSDMKQDLYEILQTIEGAVQLLQSDTGVGTVLGWSGVRWGD